MIGRIMCGGIIFTLMFVTFSSSAVYSIDLQRLYEMQKDKREGVKCKSYQPFQCPTPEGRGKCISLQYLCDNAPDCPDGYDEDSRLCTADD